MKRSGFIFCMFAFLLVSLPLKAQFFIEIEGGYNFDFLSNEISDGDFNSTVEGGTLFSLVKHSYGHGISYGCVIGYQINERISTGVGLSYLSGFKDGTTLISATNKRSRLESGTMIRIRPEVNLDFAFHNKWNLYTKLGAIVGVKNEIIIKTQSNNSSGTMIKNGGLSFGLLNELGISVNISPKVTLNFSTNLILQSYAPNKGEITSSMVNGINNLSNILTSDRFVTYVNQYQRPLGGSDLNEASISLKKSYSFSSVGINFSLTYDL